jgi:hypothetical protein
VQILLLRIEKGGTGVYVEDLDVPQNKISESAQRIIDRAIEESRRHGHGQLTNEHLLLACALVEWEGIGGRRGSGAGAPDQRVSLSLRAGCLVATPCLILLVAATND